MQDQLQKMLEESQKEVEIIGPGKDESSTLLVSDVEEYGIDMQIRYSKGNLVYEFKIPLLRSELQPYGIGTEIVQAISIGLETGKIDMSQMRSQTGSQGGGMGGRGGSRGGKGGMGGMGGKGGGMDSMSPQMPESLELWLKTELASELITP